MHNANNKGVTIKGTTKQQHLCTITYYEAQIADPI